MGLAGCAICFTFTDRIIKHTHCNPKIALARKVSFRLQLCSKRVALEEKICFLTEIVGFPLLSGLVTLVSFHPVIVSYKTVSPQSTHRQSKREESFRQSTFIDFSRDHSDNLIMYYLILI